MSPKGRGRKAQGAPTMASPKKIVKKTTSKKQVPIASPAAPEHPFEQDLNGGNQATDRDGLVGVMYI